MYLYYVIALFFMFGNKMPIFQELIFEKLVMLKLYVDLNWMRQLNNSTEKCKH